MEAIRGVKTVNQIGQEHGVHPVQVGQWQREIRERAESLCAAKRGPSKADGPGDADQRHGEIGRLKVEREGLQTKSGLSL